MTAISDFLNRLSPVEAGILTVLFLSLSYFFLRSGQQTSAPHPPVASSAPPDKPSHAPEDTPVSSSVARATLNPAPAVASEPLRAQPVPSAGPATREFMELLAHMGSEAAGAESSAGEEHWQPRAS